MGTLRKDADIAMRVSLPVIKPCPFCGKKPILMSRERFEGLQDKNGIACITISCENCHLDFYDHTHDEHNYYVRAFYVISKWNERAGEQDV